MEKSDETADGNYTAEFWEYSSKTARRWNVDPIVKIHESPYAAFAGNPIWFNDPLGADTINIMSGSIDANGIERGADNFDETNMLGLFTVYTDDDRKGEMGYAKFNRTYQTTAENYSFTVNGNDATLPYAKFLSVNTGNQFFNRAVITVTLDQQNANRQEAINHIASARSTSTLDHATKWNSFYHGKRFDIKDEGRLLDGFFLTYVEGVGVFESDFLGNLHYGNIWSGFQSLQRTLHDGDWGQRGTTINGVAVPDGVDDPLDSYGLFLGWRNSGLALTKETFIKTISFTKATTVSGMYPTTNTNVYNAGGDRATTTVNDN